MDTENPTKFVIIALFLTAALLIIAGDRWSERIGKIHAVSPAAKGGA
jgi:hypothetical protein